VTVACVAVGGRRLRTGGLLQYCLLGILAWEEYLVAGITCLPAPRDMAWSLKGLSFRKIVLFALYVWCIPLLLLPLPSATSPAAYMPAATLRAAYQTYT